MYLHLERRYVINRPSWQLPQSGFLWKYCQPIYSFGDKNGMDEFLLFMPGKFKILNIRYLTITSINILGIIINIFSSNKLYLVCKDNWLKQKIILLFIKDVCEHFFAKKFFFVHRFHQFFDLIRTIETKTRTTTK